VAIVVNASKTICVARSGLFARTAGDQAAEALVGTFVGAGLWQSLAGTNTVAAALGPNADDAARWESGVYQAAKAALRKQTGGRELLASRGGGPFQLSGFADGVPAPSGFEQVKSVMTGAERQRQAILEDKQASATAVASGAAGSLEFIITPKWQLDACPDAKGNFSARKTLILNKRFTSADGHVSIERVDVVAELSGQLNEDSRLVNFTLKVTATAKDSAGGVLVEEMIVSETKPKGDDDLLEPLKSQPFWHGAESEPIKATFTVNGKPGNLPPAVTRPYVDEVLMQATEQARKDAELNFADAYQEYYTAHHCNKMGYKPGSLKLKPGQTATIQVDMQNTSRRKGDPEWKAKSVKGNGVEVISWKPKGKSKYKEITIRAPKRSTQSAAAGASLTVDGVSIRGRGLDTLTISLGGAPSAYVGVATATETTTTPVGTLRGTLKGQNLRFRLNPGSAGYNLSEGTADWSYSGSVNGCTASWAASFSVQNGTLGGVLDFTNDRAGYHLFVPTYPASATQTIHAVCPDGSAGTLSYGRSVVLINSDPAGLGKHQPTAADGSLRGSADAKVAGGGLIITIHWQWDLTPVP
jgi:hypothetical protein